MREFSSFRHLAEQFARLALEGEAVSHELAGKGAHMIQRDAQNKLGSYQPSAGPFGAWDELADSTKADRVNKGFPEDEPLLRTGELRDSIESVVQGSEAMVGSMDPIALWQETGTDDGNLPPRSFLGAAAFESKPKLSALCAATLIAWISGYSWKAPRRRVTGPSSREEIAD